MKCPLEALERVIEEWDLLNNHDDTQCWDSDYAMAVNLEVYRKFSRLIEEVRKFHRLGFNEAVK